MRNFIDLLREEKPSIKGWFISVLEVSYGDSSVFNINYKRTIIFDFKSRILLYQPPERERGSHFVDIFLNRLHDRGPAKDVRLSFAYRHDLDDYVPVSIMRVRNAMTPVFSAFDVRYGIAYSTL